MAMRSWYLAEPRGCLFMYMWLYSQKHTLPSRRCIRLFPVCTKHWVRKRGRPLAINTEGTRDGARYQWKRGDGNAFLSPSLSPDRPALTSAPSRPGDPSCPLSPYEKSTISGVSVRRQSPWFVKRRLMLVKEKQAANLLPSQPGAAVFSRSPLFAL